MPKVSVYLPEDLYAQVKASGLSLSTVTQRALQDALGQERRKAWIEAERTRPPRTIHRLDTIAVLDEVRDEFGT